MPPERLKVWLMLTPALAVLGAVFVGGLGLGLARSLNYMPIIGLTRPNFSAWAALFRLPEFWPALGMTVYIAVVSTEISMVLAVGAALLLRRAFAGKRLIMFIFSVNLPVPHVVGAIGIMFLFSQGGFLARIAHGFGWIDQPMEFPVLVNDPWAIGIILEYVWKEVPFIGVVVLAVLQSLGQDYEDVARSLGAGPWRRLRFVILPLILPAVLPMSVLVLAFTFGDYLIPTLLGQTWPATLPVLAVRLFTDPDLTRRPEAMALAILIALIAGAMVLAYMRAARRLVRPA